MLALSCFPTFWWSATPNCVILGHWNCSLSFHFSNMLILYPKIGQLTIPDEINFQLDTELTANTTEFTLTCTSTGGPATTVSWTRGSNTLSGTSQIVNTETGTYENTLRVTMREVGTYVCTVSNNRSSASRNLTVVGKGQRIRVCLLWGERLKIHKIILCMSWNYSGQSTYQPQCSKTRSYQYSSLLDCTSHMDHCDGISYILHWRN